LFSGQGSYGDWSNVTYGIILVPWGVILTVFASMAMSDETHRGIWGGLGVVGNALTGVFIMGTYTGQLLASSYIPSSLTLSDGLTLVGLMCVPAIGVVGGLLDVFGKRSWKQGAAILGLAGASRRGLVGGVVMFLMVLPVSGNFPYQFSLLAAVLVSVFSLFLYKGLGKARILGLLVVAGSLLAGYPFYGGDLTVDGGTVMTFPVYVKSPFFLYTRVDPVWTTWAFIGLAGLIFAILGGLQTIFWKHGNSEV
jgi:hypothetical protein